MASQCIEDCLEGPAIRQEDDGRSERNRQETKSQTLNGLTAELN